MPRPWIRFEQSPPVPCHVRGVHSQRECEGTRGGVALVTELDATRGEAVAAAFLAALLKQDWAGLRSCFAENAQFRALIPPGFREAGNAVSAVEYLSGWFGDADELIVVASEAYPVVDRLCISYRIRAHEDRWYVVEQRAYCDVREGRIERMDLLCLGFRPEVEQEQGAELR